jgi:hypothetical protein
MHKQEFEHFVKYYSSYSHRLAFKGLSHQEIISYMYEHFGRGFIHSLPIECKKSRSTIGYWVIPGTTWVHSTTGPAVPTIRPPGFFILGHYMTLDEWLPLSALSPEEQIMFKLKYG